MRIVIIGNGVAGATCALAARARDPDASIVMVGQETPYFFSRTALMYALMDRMPRRMLEPLERRTWRDKRIELVQDRLVDLDADARVARLAGGRTLAWDRLVLATGARPRRAAWDGMAAVREGVVQFVSMQDLDACERLLPSTKRLVVVGGGLIGIELVESFIHHGVPVTFVVRDPWYWPLALGPEEAEWVEDALRAHGVDLRLGREVARVDVDAAGRVASIALDDGERIDANTLGVCIGVEAATHELAHMTSPPALGRGVLVDACFRTSLPDVFAIGDCAEIDLGDRRLHETIWYSAKRHGERVGSNHLFGGDDPYAPPVFFNSARLLDLDFTTVGDVFALPGGTPTRLLTDAARRVRIRLLGRDGRFEGFNGLGSRWDHERIATWIREGRTLTWVEEHLREAQYDGEFGRADLSRMARADVPFRRKGDA